MDETGVLAQGDLLEIFPQPVQKQEVLSPERDFRNVEGDEIMNCSICMHTINPGPPNTEGRCVHARSLDIAAPTFSVPVQEPTQKDYVPASRAVEVSEDLSEPYRGPSVIYGPAGPQGPEGKQGPAGAR